MTMNTGHQDTWGYLPAMTLPLEALSGDTWSGEAGMAAGGLPSPGTLSTASADAATGERWARWGAARDGARLTLTYRQTLGLALLALAAALLLYLDPHALLVAPVALITYVYLVAGIYKLWLLVRARCATTLEDVSGAGSAAGELPIYTVLVPLHREGPMLPVLTERLAQLDYPEDRLEVLLLIEADDDETHDTLATLNLPPHIRPITVPPGQPRTKPRALNVGLARATGEYIVVFDAEDRPEPDQLRKAVAAFRTLPRRIVCLQARLNVYNPRQTVLTRLFTMDYVLWYTALLPGLARAGGFVTLGGTSNHFRIQALRRLGGWDPFNVTEDCDLGARLARARLHVAMLDSTTWEEAVTQIPPWLRQRSRWVKGYLQSYLVHMRHPVHLWREMGAAGFVDFQALVGGTVFTLLVNPLMWALTAAWVLTHGTALGMFIQSLFPTAVYYPGLLCLVAGNFLFFYLNLYVCVRHGYHDLTRYSLLSPLYWLLMSVGAWMGFASLVRHPHYWAKTAHGASLPTLAPASA
jgi:cellulose synthase/poly-beta-1,6-N-acetylglucosamine synthase-like glycosyltransferase